MKKIIEFFWSLIIPPPMEISIWTTTTTFRVYCNKRYGRTLIHTNKTEEEAKELTRELNSKTRVCELGFPVFYFESERKAWKEFRPIN